MVYFTCDLCGKDLTASGDPRFVVRITAYPGFDANEIKDEDLDVDHLEAVAQLLRRDEQFDEQSPPSCKGFRYDLCPSCHSRFVKDPLGKDSVRMLDFSEN